MIIFVLHLTKLTLYTLYFVKFCNCWKAGISVSHAFLCHTSHGKSAVGRCVGRFWCGWQRFFFLGGGTEWVFQRFQVLTFIVSCRHNMRSNADVSKKFGKMTGHFVNTSSTFYNGSTINYPSRLYRYVIADVRRPKTFRISFADDTALSQFV